MRADAAKADNGYLNSHPELEHKLEKDPSKIDSQKFVDNHPGLGSYLHEHPNVRHKFKAHPTGSCIAQSSTTRDTARPGASDSPSPLAQGTGLPPVSCFFFSVNSEQ